MVKCIRRPWAFVVAVTVVLAAAVRGGADTIVLKNGDTLTGTITQIDPASVKVTSPILGALTIPRESVKILRSETKVTVIDAQGVAHTTYVGPTADAKAWAEMPAEVAPLAASPALPATTTPAVPPPPLDLERFYLPVGTHWKNQFVLGLMNASGNTNSTQITSEVDLSYKVAPSELTMKFGGAYGQTNGTQSAELAFGDVVYRRDIPEWHSDRWFSFAESHELYDGLKGISFRTNDDFGLGYYLWKDKKLSVDIRSGPGFTYEKHFDTTDTTDLVGLVGLRAVYNFSARVSLGEDFLYTNGLTNVDRYQITSDTSLNVKLPELARGLGLKMSYDDDYDSTAAAPRKQNDTRFVLGMTLDF